MKLLSKSWKENLLFITMLASMLLVPSLIRPLLEGIDLYASLVVSQLLIQVPLWGYILLTKQNPLKLMGVHRVKWYCFPLLLVATYGLLPLTMVLNLVSQMLAGSGTADLVAGLDRNLWKNLLFLAVMPAVGEEITCRGAFFGAMRKHSTWGGILMSALFFGFLHLNWNQFSYAFTIGVAFALARIVTGSVWGSIFMHFIFNANSAILVSFLYQVNVFGSAGLEVDGEMLPPEAVLVLVLFALPIVCLFLFMSALLFILIAKIMGTKQELYALFRKKQAGLEAQEEDREARSDVEEAGSNVEIEDMENIETKEYCENPVRQKEEQRKFIDPLWVVAVLVSVLVMTFW